MVERCRACYCSDDCALFKDPEKIETVWRIHSIQLSLCNQTYILNKDEIEDLRPYIKKEEE